MQTDPLAQLHDIQVPDPIGWWPLAWGWYLLIVVVAIALYLLIRMAFSAIKHRQAKKQALRLLDQARQLESPLAQVKHANDVLKRAVLAYEQRQEVAELSGGRWADWLNKQGNNKARIDADLLSLAYHRDCEPEQAERLLTQVKQWITSNLPLKSTRLDRVREATRV